MGSIAYSNRQTWQNQRTINHCGNSVGRSNFNYQQHLVESLGRRPGATEAPAETPRNWVQAEKGSTFVNDGTALHPDGTAPPFSAGPILIN
jgi:hypothetical protein